MLVEIPPRIAVSRFIGYLNEKSSTMLCEQFGELKDEYRNREFWCKGYYVDTVGKNESRIAEYIKNQLKEDQMGEQFTMSQVSPFTGSKKQSYEAGRLYYAWRKTEGYARIGKTTGLAGGCLLCYFCFFKLPFRERKYPRCNAVSHTKLFSAICKMLWGRCNPYNLRGALVFLIYHSESWDSPSKPPYAFSAYLLF